MDDFAIYLRKSRADQEAELRGEGETLARHKSALLELASKRNLHIADVYQEIVSGDSIAARPQMQKLLDMISRGAYRGVLVMEVERLARGDTIDQGIVAQAFRAMDTLIITPYRTYDPANEMDEDYFEFSLFMARREYKAITRRMQAGRAHSVKEGKYAGARDVFGYKRVKLKNQKGWTLEVVPEQAKIVQMIFNWYAYGIDGKRVGKNAIANRLNDMGLPSPRGDYWRASSIGNLLRNDVLRGYVTWNKRVKSQSGIRNGEKAKRPLSDKRIVVKGIHDAIVSDDLFNKVQLILRNNHPAPASSGASIANPFSGLLFCAICGHAMIRKEEFGPASSRKPGLICRTRGCKTSGILLSDVELAVLEALNDEYITLSPIKTPVFDQSGEKEACEGAVKSLTEQLNRVYSFAERGIYDEATFADRKEDILKRLNAARKTLDEIRSSETYVPSVVAKPRRVSVSRLYGLCDTAQQKNALLKNVLTRIVYGKTKRCHRNDNPASYLTLEVFIARIDEN